MLKIKVIRTALLLALLIIVGNISAQTVKVNVTDATGETVIGATVMEKGTSNGAITDFDGNATVKLSGKNNHLVISYVGMKTKTIDVKGKKEIKVVMEDDNTTLNDVVVIGYGTVKKKDLTGSVSSISEKQIANIPVSNVSEAMTGKMAGVNITTTEGSPDADVKIRVRGGGSLSQDNSPLYIVDGFPVSSISDIAPSEIQSIDVLKDASSTAIYGARGANGVIIITTKEGKEGKTQVNFNGLLGWKKVTKTVKTLSPYEFAQYQYELGSTDYGNYNDLDIWKSVEGSDYQDEIFGRTGLQKQYNASVNGGSKDIKFNIGFSHTDEESIMLGSGYAKNNINAKLNAKLNKWLSFDFNARLGFTKLDGLSGGADTNESNAANSIVANTVAYAPVETLTSSDDEDEANSTSTRRTPLQRITSTYKYQERFQQNYNAGLNWKPFKNITVRTEFGYGWRYNNTEQVWGSDATTNSKYGYNGQPQAQFVRVDQRDWRNANTITYANDKLFGGRDRINVLIGQEWSSTEKTTRTSTSVGYPTSMTIGEVLANTSAGTALPNESDIAADENMLSYFGRINYTMNDKYLATFTLRADGSSKFGKGNRWGYFPSLALAWRLSEEDFMKSTSSWLSNLKLRLSVGTAGNNRINSGLLSTTYSMASNTSKAPFFNEERQSMLEHGTYLYNPDLKWETTITRNIGIDFGFLRGRINGTLDFYWNTTKDLLMQTVVPSSTGYSYQFQNFGKTSNKGVELTVNTVIVDRKKWGLNFNFNIAYNKNKIDELNMENPWQSSSWSGSTISKYEDFKIEEGGRLGELWGFKTNGFFTVYDPVSNPDGQLVLEGTTWKLRDGIVDNSPSITGGSYYPGGLRVEVDENGDPLKQRLGNTVPTTTGGFGFDGRVGNFDFNVFFNYSLGNKIVNGTKLANAFYHGSAKNYNLVNDFALGSRYTWIDPETGLNLGRPSTSTIAAYGGADAMIARLNEINSGASIYNPAGVSTMQLIDYAVEDASFLRVQNITVGYTLPKKWMKSIFLDSVRIYFTGYNLFCFTGYDGYDPEVDTSSKKNPMCPGIDYAAYPKSRTFVGGINVTF
ncbi:MAG: TonB-dependent receptor [Prevotellaceae bacterium]|nr:TonB-dependent receptor [Prevotellaceae bacterium]